METERKNVVIETNSLKNIDVVIKKDLPSLIIGPSGSGKSSLAYDTIAQIGLHEYMAMFNDDIMKRNTIGIQKGRMIGIMRG